MESTQLVALQDLTFSFSGQKKLFFNKLSVQFKPGTINFIQGKNGVGKSTLLQIFSGKICNDHNLQGFLQIDSNTYNLENSSEIKKLVVSVPQNFNELLVDAYSFHENLQFVQMPRYPSLCSLSSIKPIPDLIKKYGIDFTIPVYKLSGGQRQILSMLMVLERLPKILLLDEPTAALDEENTRLVMDFLQEICNIQGMTIIAIVHSHELIDTYCSGGFFELYAQKGQRNIYFTPSMKS